MAAQKRSNNLIIVLGLLTAVVGAGLVLLLVSRGGDGDSSSGSASGDTVPVLVAKKAIPVGAAGADIGDSVEVRNVPSVTRSSDALVSLGELADRTTTIAIAPDQQLRSAFFRQRTVRGDAIKVPDGKQAVAIEVPFVNGGAGYVGPGDRVNLHSLMAKQGNTVIPLCGNELCPGGDARTQGSAYSKLVLPNVEVLDVSQEVAPRTVTSTQPTTGQVSRAGQVESSVTYLLALDANQAERAIFFARYGEVYLTLVPKGQPDSVTGGRDQSNVLNP